MRTVLIGAVESSAVALRALQAAGVAPALIVTLDPQTGRSRHSDFVDLAELAGPESSILHVQNSNHPDVVARVKSIAPDFLLVIGWSQIIGPELRAIARHCTIGGHPSALPQHRGRAPLAWTILLGLEQTGSSVFVMDDGVDNGPILAQELIDVDPRETIATLIVKHLAALEVMFARLVPKLADGSWTATPQDESGASYCAGRRPADGLIDWTCDATTIDRLVRATAPPYPGAFTFTRVRRVVIRTSEPITLSHPYFAETGQVVQQLDGCPVVRCGDASYLRLIDYETEDGKPLIGQPRFFPRKESNIS